MEVGQADDQAAIKELRTAEQCIGYFMNHQAGNDRCRGPGDRNRFRRPAGSGKDLGQRLRRPFYEG